MARKLLCHKCAKATVLLHAEDERMGWTARIVYGLAKALAVASGKVDLNFANASLADMKHVEIFGTPVCDNCNTSLPPGMPVAALTRVPPGRAIGEWESEYLTPCDADDWTRLGRQLDAAAKRIQQDRFANTRTCCDYHSEGGTDTACRRKDSKGRYIK